MGILGRIEASDLTIVGGGIAGLLLARAHLSRGHRVRLLESAPRLGGLIETRATSAGPAETAAHSLLATPAVLKLCGELGVELVPAQARGRYVARGGRLRKLPWALTPPELLATLARAALARPTLGPDASLEDWGRAHLGPAALDWVLDPFTHGIHGVPPRALLLDAAFPGLRPPAGSPLLPHLLRARRGRPRSRMMAPRPGMGALVQALARDLRAHPRCELRLGARVEALPEGPWALCAPAPEAARLLAATAPALAAALARVRYTGLAAVTAFVADSPRDPAGVGVLWPSGERRAGAPLGVLFNSSSFPGRAVAGLASYTCIFGEDATDLTGAAREALAWILGRPVELAHLEMARWPRAVPLYDGELLAALQVARRELGAGQALFGNYTGQVSLRGMIESVN